MVDVEVGIVKYKKDETWVLGFILFIELTVNIMRKYLNVENENKMWSEEIIMNVEVLLVNV